MVTRDRVGAIIQARFGSSRLPGKVLLSLPYGSGKTIVGNIVRRLKSVSRINEVIVATSDDAEDDDVEITALGAGAKVFRGSKYDVLDRFHKAALQHGLDHIIRVTADNPFIDPSILLKCLKSHGEQKADYTRTTGLPVGTNLEIVSFPTLDYLKKHVLRGDELEHLTLHLNRNRASFNIYTMEFNNFEYSKLRLTIDWEPDYALACFIYDHLYKEANIFELSDVLNLSNRYPWMKMINSQLTQRSVV